MHVSRELRTDTSYGMYPSKGPGGYCTKTFVGDGIVILYTVP